MSNRVLIFVVILVVFGAAVIIQQEKSMQQIDRMELQAMQQAQKAQLEQVKQQATVAEQAKNDALQAARQAEVQTRQVLENTMEQAQKAEEEARRKAAELQATLAGVISQAQALLDGGQFQQAIDLAKTILAQDPNNASAKSIIEKAMAALQGAAGSQAKELIGGAVPSLPGSGQ